jgi:hypothetical protein
MHSRKSDWKNREGRKTIKANLSEVLKPTRNNQFINRFTGDSIVLDVDDHNTGNIFFESVHNTTTNEIGSHLKALADNIEILAVLFPKTATFLYLSLKQFVEYAQANKTVEKEITDENDGYSSVGWPVQIKQLLKAVAHVKGNVEDPIGLPSLIADLKDPLPPVKPIAAKAPSTLTPKPKAVKSAVVPQHEQTSIDLEMLEHLLG